MSPDYDRAATKAAETLIKYDVRMTPISPLPVLEQMENVIVVPFSDLDDSGILAQYRISPLFGKIRDAVTSIHYEGDKPFYIVAYDNLLPSSMLHRALARELGHIVLKHDSCSEENTAEALCFAQHFLCPRPLIHNIEATCLRITVELLTSLTGIFDQSLRRIPKTDVPPNLNRFVRNQFMPFLVNFFGYYRHAVQEDGSAIADLGTFMEGYAE